MSKQKENWYRVKIVFRNREVIRVKLKDTQENMDNTFGMVFDVWKDNGAGGYLSLNGTHLSMNEITYFKIKKMRCRFF